MTALRQSVRGHFGEPLYKQSYLLLLSTGFSAATGLVFWILAARRAGATEVGLAAGYFAVVSFLSYVTSLALPYGVLRYAGRDGSSAAINLAFMLSAGSSVVAALVFCWGARLWAPDLAPLVAGPDRLLMFVLFNVGVAISLLLDNLFSARRLGHRAVARSLLAGCGKLVLLVPLSHLGAFGIATALLAPILVTSAVLLLVLQPLVPGYRRGEVRIDDHGRQMVTFSIRTFPGSLLAGAPPFVLPLLVLAMLGPRETAFFYVAWSITVVLLLVPNVISQLALSEGSAGDPEVVARKSRRLALAITTPLVVALCAGAGPLLGLYGPEYAANAAWPLRLFAVAALPWAFVAIAVSTLRVDHRHVATTVVTGVFCALALALSVGGGLALGLSGIAIGWTVSVVATALGIELALPGRARLATREPAMTLDRPLPTAG